MLYWAPNYMERMNLYSKIPFFTAYNMSITFRRTFHGRIMVGCSRKSLYLIQKYGSTLWVNSTLLLKVKPYIFAKGETIGKMSDIVQ